MAIGDESNGKAIQLVKSAKKDATCERHGGREQ